MRRIVYAIVIAAVLAAAAYTAFFIIIPRFAGDPISYDDTVRAGTKFPVRILRDTQGVPEIIASDRSDVFFALGYVHAQDRLNVMEYYRAIASGFADRTVPGDDGKMLRRLVTILNISSKSDEITAEIPPRSREFLDSYVRGINAWIDGSGHTKYMKTPPVERPWKTEDVIAVYLLREWADSYIANNELLFPVSEKKITSSLTDFFPREYITPYNGKYQPYVSILRYLRGAVIRRLGEDGENFSVFIPPFAKEPARVLIDQERAENTFPVRYPVRFTVDDVKYYALSDAGLPFLKAVISKTFSYSIASAKLDAMDFYLVSSEKLDGEWNYNYGGQYRPFEIRKDKTSDDEFVYRSTEFGPVISDLVRLENESVSIVTDPVKGNAGDISALLEIPFYGNAPSIRMAAASLQCYPKSILISSENDAASLLAGVLPERRVKGVLFHEYPAGRQMALSAYRSPIRGLVVSSSRIRENDFPQLREYALYRPGEKEDACVESLQNEVNISSFMRVINSSGSPSCERLSLAFDRFLTNMPVTSAKLSKTYLSEWKGEYSGKAIPPTIMNQIYFSMIHETLGDELGDESYLLNDDQAIVYDRLSEILERGNSKAFDNINTADEIETMDKVFNSSFIKAMRMLHRHYGPEMGKWRWDRVGKPVFEIPFVRTSRYSFDSDLYYDDKMHYTVDVSYSDKNNEMRSVAFSSLSMMKWGEVYWGTNFPVSLSAGSEYYGNAQRSRRLVSFDTQAVAHTIQITPDGTIKNTGK